MKRALFALAVITVLASACGDEVTTNTAAGGAGGAATSVTSSTTMGVGGAGGSSTTGVGGTSTTGAGGALTCPEDYVGVLDGEFYLALSLSIDPSKPILFLATTTLLITPNAGSTNINIDLQALDAADRTTPVGPIIPLGTGLVLSDGEFTMYAPTVDIVAAANPITGSDMSLDIMLTANACPSSVDFLCGTVDGDATAPVNVSVFGSTFAAERVSGVPYPSPPIINCAGDPGSP